MNKEWITKQVEKVLIGGGWMKLTRDGAQIKLTTITRKESATAKTH